MSEVKIMLSANFTELENGQTYYARVYTVNPEGYMQSEIGTQIGFATPQDFPADPTSYSLIGTYTTSQTWTAPENGYFMIEVHGASGKGGNASKVAAASPAGSYYFSTGSGGGGSGYACSVVRLKEGDTVEIACGAVGIVSQAVVTSSYTVEDSHTMKVTSGGNGSNSGDSQKAVSGGAGGVGSGGNVENGTGSAGSKNEYSVLKTSWDRTGAAGGNPYKSDGNVGGTGGNVTNGYAGYGVAGKSGFVNISRGNTNVVA